MKCIRIFGYSIEGDEIIRVSNMMAESMVFAEHAEYVPKKEWKKYGRKYMSLSEKRRIEGMEIPKGGYGTAEQNSHHEGSSIA